MLGKDFEFEIFGSIPQDVGIPFDPECVVDPVDEAGGPRTSKLNLQLKFGQLRTERDGFLLDIGS